MMSSARESVLTVDVDYRMQRSHFVVALDPFAECLGVGFHHLLERLFVSGAALIGPMISVKDL